MWKLISKLGLGAYLYFLWKINSKTLKKILFKSALILFVVLFYSDLQELLREISPHYLIHALILKWGLVFFFCYLILKDLSLLRFSESIFSTYISNSEDEEIELSGKISKEEKEVKESLKKYKDLDEFPELRSEIDQILEEKKINIQDNE